MSLNLLKTQVEILKLTPTFEKHELGEEEQSEDDTETTTTAAAAKERDTVTR